MKTVENPTYLYEVKLSMSLNNLDFINSFIGEILQKLTMLGITNVNVNITKIKDSDIQDISQSSIVLYEDKKATQRRRTRRSRSNSLENIKNMKNFIMNTLSERGSISRKDLMDLLKEEFKNHYKETTVVQKADLIIREFLESGAIKRKTRGIFEIVEPAVESQL